MKGDIPGKTTFRGTKKQADAKLTDILNEINTGSYVEPSRITVREFLERWLRDYVELHVPKENTRIAYRVIVNSHLIPALGAIQLAKLTPTRSQNYYREKLTSGRLKGKGKKGASESTGKPLSPKTVHNHHLALHKALECAVKWGLVARNVCDAADPPKKSHAEMTTWTPAEVVTFLEQEEPTRNSLVARAGHDPSSVESQAERGAPPPRARLSRPRARLHYP